ncbi:hypothetical protein HanXRQr2_Chr11g0506861 [Helianthus annuus]|uniref:Uncharacterized protein n=1 Tax=Helianthus annuus TaxID=4232 RepID=A0A9K3HS28_HELAN|nr:hypothetical protein HanXRQr2_Chr11g0506861 [Helianthus annuus]KAJ0876440.1 hypothetical protein HanPSC8_Chr11g0488491 [Helianthus annuus]
MMKNVTEIRPIRAVLVDKTVFLGNVRSGQSPFLVINRNIQRFEFMRKVFDECGILRRFR